MDLIPLFRSSSGLMTTVDPVRIPYDPETGVTALSRAVNITHDKTGRPIRRRGYTIKQSGLFHSLFCDGGDCFVGSGPYLYRVGTDYSLQQLRGALSGAKISYLQYNEETYYANGFQNGVIRDGVSYSWPVGAYEGPDTIRQFSGAPVGQHLAYFNTRWYISVDSVLWVSEPYAPGLFDKARGFIQFDSHIRMIKPVDTGIFISDSNNTWFFAGKDYTDFEQRLVAPYPALEWSEAIDYINAADLGLEIVGRCALWGSQEGAIIGSPDGRAINITEDKIVYPNIGAQGASLLRNKHFIHSMFF
jgi:hypothetical protein